MFVEAFLPLRVSTCSLSIRPIKISKLAQLVARLEFNVKPLFTVECSVLQEIGLLFQS